LATTETFIQRVLLAAVKAAIDVGGEVAGGEGKPTHAAHAKRAAWALETLGNPRGMAERMALGIATGGVITAESTDSDLQWTVNSLIDDFAGVD
jgi:hypothetical protein